jgi:tetratricopeptide (TPR) repeat protein
VEDRRAHTDAHETRTAETEAKKPNPLLSHATLRSAERNEEPKARLLDARATAREYSTDPAALKAWATAAMRAGETREARRAAETWAVHDNTVEPRLFLANALEQAGRKREARAVLDEWLQNHPDSAEAKRTLSRLGAAPDPAIKRGSRGHGGRSQLHPPDPVAADE